MTYICSIKNLPTLNMYFHTAQIISLFWWWWCGFIPAICSSDGEDNFSSPARLQNRLNITFFRQLNNGVPPDPYPAAKESLQLDLIDDSEPAADELLDDIREGLKYVLQTNNEWTFPVHGTGTTAVHAIMDNMIERGDKVLVLVCGYWGEVMANMSMRLGGDTVQFRKSPGSRFNLIEVESRVMIHRPKILAMVHGESSTGVHQNLDGFGDMCRRHGIYLVVDSISVVGIRALNVDHYKVDCSITSSHKGIGGIAGLGVVSLSDRAVNRIKNRKYPPVAYQTDLILQREMWKTPVIYRPQTLSLGLLYAMREGLGTIAREGKENVYKRHLKTNTDLENGLRAMGLVNFVRNPEDRMTCFPTFYPPKGKSIEKIVHYISKNFKIFISYGAGPTKGKVLRFVTFGSNASTERIDKLLKAMKSALDSSETDST